MVVLRSEIPSGICAKLRTVAARNNRVLMPWSLYYCLFAPRIVWCCSSRTSRSWWITQSTQHHRRGCNSRLPADIATNSKMIHKSKGSILLIWNLLNFDWETHIFLKSIGHLIHVTFCHLTSCLGPPVLWIHSREAIYV